ncbi:MAG: glycoside hydrolase family 97 catalytic domain-containing protein [Bacteroidales bacterium]
MKKNRIAFLIFIISILSPGAAFAKKQPSEWFLNSPDGKITFTIAQNEQNELTYTVKYGEKTAIESSRLGVIMDGGNLSKDLLFVSATNPSKINEAYELKVGKQLKRINHCKERQLIFKGQKGRLLTIQMRAYNDGIAFRYGFPENSANSHMINEELTEFAIPAQGKAWLCPYTLTDRLRACYEEYAAYGIPIRSEGEEKNGWAFPLLIETSNGLWMLVSEASNDGSYPATHVDNSGRNKAYKIRFPEFKEAVYPDAPSEPISVLPWITPWRTVAIGSDLNTIFNTQIITHLNPPSTIKDQSWIKPGRSSWSWWSEGRVRSCNRQLKYADLSADLNWEYMLVDAGWPKMKDGGNIEDVIKHATSQDVGVWVWYSSFAGEESHENRERRLMTDPKLRKEEMRRIRALGVKGIKVDFFDTDKQQAMKLYLDILNDAAENQLMVNFHGSTLPRGWERTYPNLMTMEAVKGAEGMGQQARCDNAPRHHTALVFMRNIVGSMDYTPCIFSIKNPNAPKPGIPRTSYAHQLALSVVFESGLQCFADNERFYTGMPQQVKDFLTQVPSVWEESILVDGYPGEYAIIMRRNADKWYIGAINGSDKPRTLSFKLPAACKGSKKMNLIVDGENITSFGYKTINTNNNITVELPSHGGFAGTLE